MPAITYDRFDVGLDLRKGASVSDANRLRQLKNAYITTGRAIAKRPGLVKVATLEAGTVGLFAGLGKLNTFYGPGTITHANTLFVARKVAHPTVSQAATRFHHAEVFDGYIYGVVEYADGSTWHHYLDGGSPTHIADVNCPQSKALVKTASKLWAVADNVVRFCATGLPRNWTLTDDAGFLPTGLQQRGSLTAMALGMQNRDLVVFFDTSSQIWVPDPDPALHVFKKPINGVGTRYARSVENVSDDVFFLSDQGYRSITSASQSDNLTDIDVGSPIDALVKPLLTSNINPVAVYSPVTGQYLCAIGSTVHAFTFSRSNKISAWSEYTYAGAVDDWAVLDGKLYMRRGNDVYRVDDSVHTDDGVAYTMTIELPFLDMKKSGVLKQFKGLDAVVEGSVDIQFRWDPNNPSLITSPITLTGDSHVNALVPMEMIATQIAPVLTSTTTSPVQLDALTFYFDEIAVL